MCGGLLDVDCLHLTLIMYLIFFFKKVVFELMATVTCVLAVGFWPSSKVR